MTIEDQFNDMLAMQDKLNSEIHKDWRNRHYNFDTALFVECAECIDAIGYKWWKKQESDDIEVQQELIDIWHFILSIVLVQKNERKILAQIEKATSMAGTATYSKAKIIDILKGLNANSIQNGVIVRKFIFCLHAYGIDFDDLHYIYMTKNCVNLVRARHGYSEGTYKKDWEGVPDSVKAYELRESFEGTFDEFYTSLEEYYRSKVA